MKDRNEERRNFLFDTKTCKRGKIRHFVHMLIALTIYHYDLNKQGKKKQLSFVMRFKITNECVAENALAQVLLSSFQNLHDFP